MAEMELYRITEEIPYFEVAQKIYLNALGHAQRINGGFGCDNCVGAESPFLTVHGNGVDAFWCCSMRTASVLIPRSNNQLSIADRQAPVVL